MIKHLNVKKICAKNIDSYKYSEKDEELYNMSLIKDNKNIKSNNSLICIYCNKDYSTKSNLLQHINKYCKKKNIEDNENNIQSNIPDIKDSKPNENISKDKLCIEINKIPNINIDKNINGNNNIDNSINNITNINFNINVIKSFDDDWSIDHLDNKDKLVLLLNNSKFTSTLENILENEVNLNVLIENNDNNGLVIKIIN
jgi:hypothetical protein